MIIGHYSTSQDNETYLTRRSNMAEEDTFQNIADNKNPLYALSQAQGDSMASIDSSPGHVRQHSRNNSADTSPGSMNGSNNGANGAGSNVTNPPNQSNSGSSSPESKMKSKDLRSNRLSMSEDGKDIQGTILCPKVNCPEKIVS